jgi:heavy metal efflux system protein
MVLIAGGFAASTIPLDAVPDLTNVQVQVLTNSPSLGPVEVEQFITFPVENAMSGLPRIAEIRSISRFGLSAVTVAFEEGTDIYWARNLINERLQKARQEIPAGMGDPQMGPIATGMSEIYQFEVRAKQGTTMILMELRTVLDWQIAFQLRSVLGVMGSLEDIRSIVLDSRNGIPIRISDIAQVRFAPMLRQGAVTRDGDLR